MRGTMRGAVMYGIDDMRIEEMGIPQVGDDEVLVRTRCVGVCGSDLHFYKEGRIGEIVVTSPVILGHEVSGEIVEVGRNVADKHVGAKVIMEPGIPCGRCRNCKAGRYNLCPSVIFRACPPVHGTLAEYLVSRSDMVYEVPDSMSFEQIALLEPLSVATNILKWFDARPSSTVTILGSGTIGLSVLQTLRARGVRDIIMTDLLENRLQMALKLGASAVVKADEVDTVTEVRRLTGNRGADIVIEAAGSEETYFASTGVATRGGRVVLLGMAARTVFPMNLDEIVNKELSVQGSFRYCNGFFDAIALESSGQVNMRAIVTHRFPFEQVVEAFDVAHEKRDGAVKVVVSFQD